MTTAIHGRREQAERLAEILRSAGHSPKSVAVLGKFAHAVFLGENAARAIVPLMQRGGFRFLKIVRSVQLNCGETGGYGSKYHDEWTAHFKVS